MMEFGDTARVIGGVVAAAAALASLVPITADLIGWKPLRESSRPTRTAIAIILVVISIVSGVIALRMPRESTPTTIQVFTTAPSPKDQPIDAGKAVAAAALTEVPAARKWREPAAPAPSEPVRLRSEITVSEREQATPYAIAAADDALTFLRRESHTVRGTLRGTQSQPDDSLQGMITTDFVLDVKLIDASGHVMDTFTITSRGGGFTADASGLQARQRLLDALQERVKKERL